MEGQGNNNEQIVEINTADPYPNMDSDDIKYMMKAQEFETELNVQESEMKF